MNKLIICLRPRTAFRHVGCEATTQVVESCGARSTSRGAFCKELIHSIFTTNDYLIDADSMI